MAKRYSTLFRWINVVVDYLIVNTSLYFCFLLADIELIWSNVYNQRLMIFLLNFCWFFSSNSCNVYDQFNKWDAAPVLNSTIASLCVFLAVVVFVKITLPLLYIPPVPFIYYFILLATLLIGWRFSFLFVRKYKRKFWFGSYNIVIIGASPVGMDFYNYINLNPQMDCRALGFFDDFRDRVSSFVEYLGNVDQCFDYAAANNVREVYCALPYSECDRIEALMQEADKRMIRFRIIPDLKVSLSSNCLVEFFDYVLILKPREEPLENKANEILKRYFDVMFSSSIIVLLLICFFPLIALIIKMDTAGHVFFRQFCSGKTKSLFIALCFAVCL